MGLMNALRIAHGSLMPITRQIFNAPIVPLMWLHESFAIVCPACIMSKRKQSMNYSEMVAMETEHKSKSSMYQTDKGQALQFAENKISEIVAKTAIELGNISNKQMVSLNDTSLVKDITAIYLKACIESAVLPTMQGFARALGLE